MSQLFQVYDVFIRKTLDLTRGFLTATELSKSLEGTDPQGLETDVPGEADLEQYPNTSQGLLV